MPGVGESEVLHLTSRSEELIATQQERTSFPGAPKCALPYMREEELGDRLGQILKDIYIPDEILGQLEQFLLQDKGRAEAQTKAESERLKQRLAQVRGRTERAYLDKLDGKISDEFWTARCSDWNREEQAPLWSYPNLPRPPQGFFPGPIRDSPDSPCLVTILQ